MHDKHLNMHLQPKAPHLRKSNGCTQLIVDGKPYLALAAELHNSSMSSAEHMSTIWPSLAKDNINTVLGCVGWEQIEPIEGHFDFSNLDKVILGARDSGLRLVLLWFGSFKNGLSTYAPRWVKQNPKRFPRAKLRDPGGRISVADNLSVVATELQAVEAKTFRRLMQHLREVDEGHYTVIMVQVENEIGILGDSRDGSAAADALFASPVPEELVEWLEDDFASLHPTLQSMLQPFCATRAAIRRPLSWPETFGGSLRTDELFMAYHYARFVQGIAAAGKEAYDIPFFTNVWQNYGAGDRDPSVPIVVGGGSDPGIYPSGGGVINVLDVWQVWAPSLDFVAPDIYLNDYSSSCFKYRHRGQALFIPEQRRDEYGVRRIWDAFGTHGAIGTSPFGIDTVRVEHNMNPFARHYRLLAQVKEHVLAAQRRPGSSAGFFFDELPMGVADALDDEKKIFRFDDWALTIERSFVFGRPSAGCGMVIYLGEARFLLVGWGFQVSVRSTRPDSCFTGILAFEEKAVTDPARGTMKTVRLLNGDETRSGQSAVMPSENPDYGGFPISISIPASTGIAQLEVYSLSQD